MKKSIATILVGFIVFACTNAKPENPNYISPQELNKLMQTEDIFLVDVHVPERRHIKGTDLFLPFNRIEENIEKFPTNKNTPVYLYCQGGPMADAAAEVLMKQGYTKVYNLEGGSDAWEYFGFEFQ